MARPRKSTKHPGGRPTVFTEATLQKLEQGFKIGYTDEQCCAYADIAMSTLYNYQSNNPEFLEKKAKWKQNPMLKAKYTLYKNLDDPKIAQWYAERKGKDEFSVKVEQEITSQNTVINVSKEDIRQVQQEILNLADE